MKHEIKRFLSMILVFSMCFSMVPGHALAQEPEKGTVSQEEEGMQSDSGQPEPAAPEPADPEPAVPEPADPEPADPEPADPEPADPEPADPEPADPEPADPEPAVPEPAQSEPAQTDPEEALYTIEVLGGTASHTQAAPGTEITLTAGDDPHRIFLCWYLNEEEQPLEGNTFPMPEQNVVVHGVFRQAWQVSVEGGTAQPQTVSYGDSTTVTADHPDRFLCWEGEGLTEEQSAMNPLVIQPEGDLTLKAVYEEKEQPQQPEAEFSAVLWDYGYGEAVADSPEGTALPEEFLIEGEPAEIPGFTARVKQVPEKGSQVIYTLETPTRNCSLTLDPAIAALGNGVQVEAVLGEERETLTLSAANGYRAEFTCHVYDPRGRILTPFFSHLSDSGDFPLELTGEGRDVLTYSQKAEALTLAASAEFSGEEIPDGTVTVEVLRRGDSKEAFALYGVLVLSRGNGFAKQTLVPGAGREGKWEYRMRLKSSPQGFAAQGDGEAEGTGLKLSFAPIPGAEKSPAPETEKSPAPETAKPPVPETDSQPRPMLSLQPQQEPETRQLKLGVTWKDIFDRPFAGPDNLETLTLSLLRRGEGEWETQQSVSLSGGGWEQTVSLPVEENVQWKLEAENLPEDYVPGGCTLDGDSLTLPIRHCPPIEDGRMIVRFTDPQGKPVEWPVDRTDVTLSGSYGEPIPISVEKPERGLAAYHHENLPVTDPEGRRCTWKLSGKEMIEAEGISYLPISEGLEVSFRETGREPVTVAWMDDYGQSCGWPVEALSVSADGTNVSLTPGHSEIPLGTRALSASLEGWTMVCSQDESGWRVTGYQHRSLSIDVQWQDPAGNEIPWPEDQKDQIIRVPLYGEQGENLGTAKLSRENPQAVCLIAAVDPYETPIRTYVPMIRDEMEGYGSRVIGNDASDLIYHVVLRKAPRFRIHLLVLDEGENPIWLEDGSLPQKYEDFQAELTVSTDQPSFHSFRFGSGAQDFRFQQGEYVLTDQLPAFAQARSMNAAGPEGWDFTWKMSQQEDYSLDYFVTGREVRGLPQTSVEVRWNYGYGDETVPDVQVSGTEGPVLTDYQENNSANPPVVHTLDLTAGSKTIYYDPQAVPTAESFQPHPIPGFRAEVSGNGEDGFVIRYLAVPVDYTIHLAEGLCPPKGDERLEVTLWRWDESDPDADDEQLEVFLLNEENGYCQKKPVALYNSQGMAYDIYPTMEKQTVGDYVLELVSGKQETVLRFGKSYPQAALTLEAEWLHADGTPISPYLLNNFSLKAQVQRSIAGADYENLTTITLGPETDWAGLRQVPLTDGQGNACSYRLAVDEKALPQDYEMEVIPEGKFGTRIRMTFHPEMKTYPIQVSFRDGRDQLRSWPEEQILVQVERVSIDGAAVAQVEVSAPEEGYYGRAEVTLPSRFPDGSPAHYVAIGSELDGYYMLDGKPDSFDLVYKKDVSLRVQVLWQDEAGKAIQPPEEVQELKLMLGNREGIPVLTAVIGSPDWVIDGVVPGDLYPSFVRPLQEVPGFTCTYEKLPGDDPDDQTWQLTYRRNEKPVRLSLQLGWQLEEGGKVYSELLPGLPEVILDIYQNGKLYQTLYVDQGSLDEFGFSRPRLPSELMVPAQGPEGIYQYTVVPRAVHGFACPQQTPVQAVWEDGGFCARILYRQVPAAVTVALEQDSADRFPDKETITAQLLRADDGEVLRTLVLSRENGWSREVTGLRIYEEDGTGGFRKLNLRGRVADQQPEDPFYRVLPMNQEGVIAIRCNGVLADRQLKPCLRWQDSEGAPMEAPSYVESVTVKLFRQTEQKSRAASSQETLYKTLTLEGPEWEQALTVPDQTVFGDRFLYRMEVTPPEGFEMISGGSVGPFRAVLRQLPREKTETLEVLWRDCYGRQIPWPQDQVELTLSGNKNQEIKVLKPKTGNVSTREITLSRYDDQGKPISWQIEQPQPRKVAGITYDAVIDGFRVMWIARARVSLRVRWEDGFGRELPEAPEERLTLGISYREGETSLEIAESRQWKADTELPGRRAPYGVKPQQVPGFLAAVSQPVRNSDADYIFTVTYEKDMERITVPVTLRFQYGDGHVSEALPEGLASVPVTMYRRAGNQWTAVSRKLLTGADTFSLPRMDGEETLAYQAAGGRIPGFGPGTVTGNQQEGFVISYETENVSLRAALDRALVPMETRTVRLKIRSAGQKDRVLVLEKKNQWKALVPGGVPLYTPEGRLCTYQVEPESPDFLVSGSLESGYQVGRVVPNPEKQQTLTIVFKDNTGRVSKAPVLCQFLTVRLLGRSQDEAVWEQKVTLYASSQWEKTLTVPAEGPSGETLSYTAECIQPPRGYQASLEGEGTDHITLVLQSVKRSWIPRTGDDSRLGLWAAAGLLSLAALAAWAWQRRKKK